MAEEVGTLQEQTVLRPELGTGAVYSEQRGETEKEIGPVSWSDKLKAKAQIMASDTAIGVPGLMPEGLDIGLWGRAQIRSQMEKELEKAGSPKITPDEANLRFPGMPEPFKEPIHPEIAQILYDDQQIRNKYNNYIERGGGAGLGLSLIAGMPTMIDPINLAASLATGGAFKALGIGQSLAASFSENLIGNLAADIPNYILQKKELQDPSVLDTVAGSVGGAVLGTGMGAVLKYAGKKLSAKEKTSALGQAIAQDQVGKKTDVTNFVTTLKDRISGKTKSTEPATKLETVGYHPSEQTPLIENFADETAVHISDSEHVATNIEANAKDSFDTKEIVAIDYDRTGKNFLDVDSKMDSPDLAQFKQMLESKLSPEELKLLNIDETDTVMDIKKAAQLLEDQGKITPGFSDKFKQAAIESGHAGVKQTTADNNTNFVVFDKQAISEIDRAPINEEVAYKPGIDDNKKVLQEMDTKERDVFYNPDAQKTLSVLPAQNSVESAIELKRKNIEQFNDRILKETKDVDVEVMTKEMNAETKQIKDELDSLNAFADCITKGII